MNLFIFSHLTGFFKQETVRPKMVLIFSTVLFFNSTRVLLQSTNDSLILLVLSWFPNILAFCFQVLSGSPPYSDLDAIEAKRHPSLFQSGFLAAWYIKVPDSSAKAKCLESHVNRVHHRPTLSTQRRPARWKRRAGANRFFYRIQIIFFMLLFDFKRVPSPKHLT